MITPGGPAVLLPNGKVFISAAQLYDPSSATFSATAAETSPTTATLLPNGQVLLTTADDWGPGELYAPSTDTFSPTANINYETATLLMNGKVLFISDPDHNVLPHPTNEAQLYDLSTGTFTAAGSMTIGREAHTATLLPDGTVLIAGTQLPGGGALASAEIYDPVLGTFGPTGSMIRARHSQKATLLNNGQVLITGGWDLYPAMTSSAELYTPPVLVPAPVLFSLPGDGRGQGAIWHAATGQVASATNPAVVGEALSMYTTSLSDGGVIPPQVAVGGRLAEVLYFGAFQLSRLQPGELPRAERRCLWPGRSSAPDLPRPTEQRSHDRCAVIRSSGLHQRFSEECPLKMKDRLLGPSLTLPGAAQDQRAGAGRRWQPHRLLFVLRGVFEIYVNDVPASGAGRSILRGKNRRSHGLVSIRLPRFRTDFAGRQWIAYISNRSGEYQVWLQQFHPAPKVSDIRIEWRHTAAPLDPVGWSRKPGGVLFGSGASLR